MNKEVLSSIFEMLKPFFNGLIKYWWIIAIVLVASVIFGKTNKK